MNFSINQTFNTDTCVRYTNTQFHKQHTGEDRDEEVKQLYAISRELTKQGSYLATHCLGLAVMLATDTEGNEQ